MAMNQNSDLSAAIPDLPGPVPGQHEAEHDGSHAAGTGQVILPSPITNRLGEALPQTTTNSSTSTSTSTSSAEAPVAAVESHHNLDRPRNASVPIDVGCEGDGWAGGLPASSEPGGQGSSGSVILSIGSVSDLAQYYGSSFSDDFDSSIQDPQASIAESMRSVDNATVVTAQQFGISPQPIPASLQTLPPSNTDPSPQDAVASPSGCAGPLPPSSDRDTRTPVAEASTVDTVSGPGTSLVASPPGFAHPQPPSVASTSGVAHPQPPSVASTSGVVHPQPSSVAPPPSFTPSRLPLPQYQQRESNRDSFMGLPYLLPGGSDEGDERTIVRTVAPSTSSRGAPSSTGQPSHLTRPATSTPAETTSAYDSLSLLRQNQFVIAATSQQLPPEPSPSSGGPTSSRQPPEPSPSPRGPLPTATRTVDGFFTPPTLNGPPQQPRHYNISLPSTSPPSFSSSSPPPSYYNLPQSGPSVSTSNTSGCASASSRQDPPSWGPPEYGTPHQHYRSHAGVPGVGVNQHAPPAAAPPSQYMQQGAHPQQAAGGRRHAHHFLAHPASPMIRERVLQRISSLLRNSSANSDPFILDLCQPRVRLHASSTPTGSHSPNPPSLHSSHAPTSGVTRSSSEYIIDCDSGAANHTDECGLGHNRYALSVDLALRKLPRTVTAISSGDAASTQWEWRVSNVAQAIERIVIDEWSRILAYYPPSPA
ncbi:hypothetical protein FA13DRAFT_1789208 [Coprinellus micaceus]|uniref:Uncharacterized protein n=1 Tax=Coprinellus micaceus TaxID=71717 RepID=A0A4Y7TIL9_COPMI|nr:hypothetical protein FA13DRAFT_1789208 [Coprinellus micaceus]